MAEPIPFDIPLILQVLRPDDDWGPHANTHDTYELLSKHWRGKNPCPTLEEMQAAALTLKPPVPSSVKMWQLQTILLQRNILQRIDDYVNSNRLINPRLYFEWTRSSDVRRDSEWFQKLAPEFNFTDEDVDQIFREANTLAH